MGAYIGVSDKARNIKNVYIGVNGVARKVKKIYIGDSNNIARLCYSSGGLCYCGSDGIYQSNDNGATWTKISTNTTVKNIWYNDGYYIGIGDNQVYRSTDMINWSSSAPTTMSVNAGGATTFATYENGVYLATVYRAGTYYSTDFSNWTLISVNTTYVDFYCYNQYNGNLCINAYDNAGTYYLYFLTAYNGSVYTSASSGSSVQFIQPISVGNFIVYGKDYYVVFVNQSQQSANYPMGSYYSGDKVVALCHVNGTVYAFVDRDYSKIYLCKTSDNGTSWSQTETNFKALAYNLLKLYYYNGMFYAIYYYFNNNAFEYHLVTSSDAITWNDTIVNSSFTNLTFPTNNNGMY